MLTMITGTPGAGKSLYAVWHFAKPVPGSTIEQNGDLVPRRLLSNVKGLLVEHEVITGEDLDKWHTWAKPGDVILFDEVQEVWRPRGLGSKVPECIAALETHRHLGVDIILVTQHPMLVDPNIRRLVNQHLHLRRLAKTVAMVYEWDHCSNPGMVKTALQSRVWFHPKAAYGLYKSAQLHTKPTARLPRIAIVGVLALATLGFMVPWVYGRFTERFSQGIKPADSKLASSPAGTPKASPLEQAAGQTAPPAPSYAAVPAQSFALQVERPAGCISFRDRCQCFDASGMPVTMDDEVCKVGSHRVGFVIPAGPTRAPELPIGGDGGKPPMADSLRATGPALGSPVAPARPIS